MDEKKGTEMDEKLVLMWACLLGKLLVSQRAWNAADKSVALLVALMAEMMVV